ncbi:hypothetical protein AWB80_07532 [Caballeronia pedi]|uniref:Helix-turn-helix domain-containing protein n=1 Tax=Caballeronia pedi TaxID=1777141 RepID=A0A158DV61_9BURK|nr:hypothetical protein [Caballeronia pedi]SAK98485.1 hypothetical protein AWB80_07532 [Caballeronia pedi]
MPISTEEAAKRHGVSKRRIQALLKQERIPGATRFNGDWMLPDDFTILPPPVFPEHRGHPAQRIEIEKPKPPRRKAK